MNLTCSGGSSIVLRRALNASPPRSAPWTCSEPSARAAIEDGADLVRGYANLDRHILNVISFGLAPVVVLNRFADDTDAVPCRAGAVPRGARDDVAATP